MNEQFYTADEAASIFRVKVETIREWIKEEKLPATKIGRRYLIPKTEVMNLLEEKHG